MSSLVTADVSIENKQSLGNLVFYFTFSPVLQLFEPLPEPELLVNPDQDDNLSKAPRLRGRAHGGKASGEPGRDW